MKIMMHLQQTDVVHEMTYEQALDVKKQIEEQLKEKKPEYVPKHGDCGKWGTRLRCNMELWGNKIVGGGRGCLLPESHAPDKLDIVYFNIWVLLKQIDGIGDELVIELETVKLSLNSRRIEITDKLIGRKFEKWLTPEQHRQIAAACLKFAAEKESDE